MNPVAEKPKSKSTSIFGWVLGVSLLAVLGAVGYVVAENIRAGNAPFDFSAFLSAGQTDPELDRLEAELERLRAERKRQEALAATQPRKSAPVTPIAPVTPVAPPPPVQPVPPIAQASPPVTPVTPPPAQVANVSVLNGNWYSAQWKYGYTLNNGVGTATSTNSPNFAVGQKIIFLAPVSQNEFVGEQVYTDGKFYKIRATLQADGRLFFQGEKNVNWFMDRQGGQNSSSNAPPVASSLSALKEQARNYVRTYNGTWSRDDVAAMDFVRRAYADQVDFHGARTSKADIVKQKLAFTQRWPVRYYKERDDSMFFNCSTQSSQCAIDGILDWDVRSQERNARSTGTAQFGLTVDFSVNPPRILTESSKVLNRSQQ